MLKYRIDKRIVRIDPEDAPLMEKWKWRIYYINKWPYVGRSEGGRIIYLHRVIMSAPAGRTVQVDHIDKDTLNDCRSNLRLVSTRGNQLNTDRATNLNITRHKNSWRARIRMPDGRRLERYGQDVEELRRWWSERDAERRAEVFA